MEQSLVNFSYVALDFTFHFQKTTFAKAKLLLYTVKTRTFERKIYSMAKK